MYGFKSVCPFDELVVLYIDALAYSLAQLAKYIGVKLILNFLILGMFPQLSVFERLSCFFIKYGNVPVKDKLARVTPS